MAKYTNSAVTMAVSLQRDLKLAGALCAYLSASEGEHRDRPGGTLRQHTLYPQVTWVSWAWLCIHLVFLCDEIMHKETQNVYYAQDCSLAYQLPWD